MAKEKPDTAPNGGPPKPATLSPLPLGVRLLAGVAFATPQPDLFASELAEPGVDAEFVSRVFTTALPLLRELAIETVRRIPSDKGIQLQLNQTSTATLSSLQVVATKPLGFTHADVSTCATLSAGLTARLEGLMKRIASDAPLIRQQEDTGDLVLQEVARIKQRGISIDFLYGVFSVPVESTNVLQMTLVQSRKRSPFLQGGKPEEVHIRGAIKMSQSGERIRVSRIDGERSVPARIEHGDPLAYEAHAAATGGNVTCAFEKTTSHCKAAPEIERIDYRLVRIIADDLSIESHLNKLIDAANTLLSRLKALKK